jgi:hypothetical protein
MTSRLDDAVTARRRRRVKISQIKIILFRVTVVLGLE